jgi:hypothetical protein
MKRLTRATVRKVYRQGLLEVFGCGDKDIDKDLVRALGEDVHLAGQAPGGWVSDEGILEIYCENGIPNASDVNEFHFDGKYHVSYNCEKWFKVDKYVNLFLQGMGFSERIFHEPHNGAVVAVHWS